MVLNPLATHSAVAPGWAASPPGAPLDLHRRLPGYRATPLVSVPCLASHLGVGSLLVKYEVSRFGLPSFKMLGASWAVYRALCQRLGGEPEPWQDVTELASRLSRLRPLALAAATDGNHGRAVARMAGLLGLDARIFVPEGTSAARVRAIESEGAAVEVVAGDYDAAVARSAELAGPGCLVVSDTSWPGYTEIPGWVIDGYSTMFWEVEEAMATARLPRPDAVVVPVGVGALAAAAVSHYRRSDGPFPVLIGVEPTSAACVGESVSQGRTVTVPGPHPSVMVGLNCGTPSTLAWPIVSKGVDAFVAIDDDWARKAVRALACAGMAAGETGAAALGGLLALKELLLAEKGGSRSEKGGRLAEVAASLAGASTVLALCTEGVTDPLEWRRSLGVELVGGGANDRGGTGGLPTSGGW